MWTGHLNFLSETTTVASESVPVNPGYFQPILGVTRQIVTRGDQPPDLRPELLRRLDDEALQQHLLTRIHSDRLALKLVGIPDRQLPGDRTTLSDDPRRPLRTVLGPQNELQRHISPPGR